MSRHASRLEQATFRRAGRRAPQRSWLRSSRTARREPRPAALSATVALRPQRTILRTSRIVTSRVTQLVRTVSPVTVRSAAAIHLGATLSSARERTPSGASERTDAAVRVQPVPAALRSLVQTIVQRERSERHVRIERPGARPLSGPPGTAGEPGPAGHPSLPLVLTRTSPSLVLTRTSPSPVPDDEWPTVAIASHEMEILPPAAVPPPAPQLFQVDALAAQVLERIERRAVAQRERMGWA